MLEDIQTETKLEDYASVEVEKRICEGWRGGMNCSGEKEEEEECWV